MSPRRRTLLRLVCPILAVVVLLGTTPAARASTARELLKSARKGLVSGVSEFAAEIALNAAASFLYKHACGDDQVTDDIGEFICSVVGDVSGEHDAEWRAEVADQLDGIQSQLDDVKAGQKALEKTIENQAEWLRDLIDDLPENLRVHDDLANIQNAWTLFTEYFEDAQLTSPEAAREDLEKLARRLLKDPTLKLPTAVLDLRVAIVDGHGGKPPLPMLLAQEIERRLRSEMKDRFDRTSGDPSELDIMPYYLQLETAVQQWMLRQRQAHVMVLFAARVLEESGETTDLSPRQLGLSYYRDLERQLESFQRAVEWLVVGSSFPLSPFANFLPRGAEEALQCADIVQAIHLSPPPEASEESRAQAIWGRVIGMGDDSGGELTLRAPGKKQGETLKGTVHTFPVRDFSELDWWAASSPARKDVFDVVHFAKQWKVYRYKLELGDQAQLGDYRFAAADPGNALPYLPPTIGVDDSLSGITGRSTRLGTFVGISRAGGAFALFSGDFTKSEVDKLQPYENRRDLGPSTPTDKYVALTHEVRQVDRSRGSMPRILLGERGTTKIVKANNFGVNLPFEVLRHSEIRLRNDKKIRSADGESLELHVLWNDEDLALDWLDESAQRAIVAANDWQVPPLAATGDATYSAELDMLFGGVPGAPGQGLKLSKSGSNRTPISASVPPAEGELEPARLPIVLSKAGANLNLVARLELALPRAAQVRTWTLLSRAGFRTAYLTRP